MYISQSPTKSSINTRRLIGLLLLTFLLWGCGSAEGLSKEETVATAPNPVTAGQAIYQINAGGPVTGTFSEDKFFTGGGAYSNSNTITTAGVANAAPAAVYQSERYGTHSYTVTGLTPNTSYVVRLHFAEIYYTQVGKRSFNVAINGAQVISNLDLFAVAGYNTAYVRDFTVNANASGAIVVDYTTVRDNAKSSGLEILATSDSTPPPSTTLTAVYQINDGGEAVGGFTADQFVTGGTAYRVTNTIATDNVANAAPAAVYQTERNGNHTYNLTGLTPNASYTVRLHLAEIYYTQAGKRSFNVVINGNQVISNLDLYAVAGYNKAYVREFTTNASSSGAITVQYVTVVDNATSAGLEVLSTGSTTPPTTPPSSGTVYQINAGGTATGTFSADRAFTGGGSYTVTNSINTSVANAAPAGVYQSERWGTHTYNLTSLTPNATYTVRLHFAEIYYTKVGQRSFNVVINGNQVISNMDLYAVAGYNKAYVRDFVTTANASGAIVVDFVTVKDNAKSSGIEVIAGTVTQPSNNAPTVASNAAANPSTVNGTTTSLSVLGADDGGESALTYSWAATGSPPAAVAFSATGSNAAKSTTATFSASGNYTLRATITDAQGLTTQSSVNVSVTLPSGIPGGSGWQLAWSDEFNGSSVDTAIWNYWLNGQQRRAAINRAENTFVSNGSLTVRITKDAGGQLTAGGLQSKRGFGSGYFEIRGKVLGGWSTFWLQSPGIENGTTPAADGTEMDIMEACCPGPVSHSVHWGGYGSGHQTLMGGISGVTQSDWNTYGLEWTPTSYKFWVNGKLNWTFTTAVSQRTDEWIRLTQETDGDFCGGQCDFLVDYVRVYTPSP